MGQLYEGVGELEKAVASYRRYHVFFYLVFSHALEGTVVLKMAINFLGFTVNHYHHHYHHNNNNNINDNNNNNGNDNDDGDNNN